MTKTYAYLRDDILEKQFYPPTSMPIHYDEWQGCFEVVETDDFETEEGYNLMLKNYKGKTFLTCSIDFKFKPAKT